MEVPPTGLRVPLPTGVVPFMMVMVPVGAPTAAAELVLSLEFTVTTKTMAWPTAVGLGVALGGVLNADIDALPTMMVPRMTSGWAKQK